MAGIVGQADYYGLPEQSRPEPPAGEHLAELLKKPTPWSGPAKLASDDPDEPSPETYEAWGDRMVERNREKLGPSHRSED